MSAFTSEKQCQCYTLPPLHHHHTYIHTHTHINKSPSYIQYIIKSFENIAFIVCSHVCLTYTIIYQTTVSNITGLPSLITRLKLNQFTGRARRYLYVCDFFLSPFDYFIVAQTPYDLQHRVQIVRKIILLLSQSQQGTCSALTIQPPAFKLKKEPNATA